MEFFLDTAEIEEIERGLEMGLVDGITTNPSLIARAGKSYLPTLKEISKLVSGPISGEVLATTYEAMLKQAQVIADIGKNMVVKVPMGVAGIRVVKELDGKGIKTNVTLCFSASQALLAAKAGATYISPFVGRLDDIGQQGISLIEEIKEIYSNYTFATKVLVASVRNCQHVVDSARLGAEVVTLPFSVLRSLYKHQLTDSGLESFLKDWEATGRTFEA